jgi:hypothetical protein
MRDGYDEARESESERAYKFPSVVSSPVAASSSDCPPYTTSLSPAMRVDVCPQRESGRLSNVLDETPFNAAAAEALPIFPTEITSASSGMSLTRRAPLVVPAKLTLALVRLSQAILRPFLIGEEAQLPPSSALSLIISFSEPSRTCFSEGRFLRGREKENYASNKDVK